MAGAICFHPSNSWHMDMVSQFADIQIDCIKSDKMVADYMPPLDKKKMELWWAERANEVASEPPSRHIIFMEENGEATGVVMLALNTTETGRFRGQVQKLIVSPKHRRKGIARIMMAMVEKVATADGRTMLLLDTEKASPADKMYPKWGYQQCGFIPDYELRPDGGFMDGTFYFKNLAASDAISLT